MKKSSLKASYYYWQIDIRICHTILAITFIVSYISSQIGELALRGHIISGIILSFALIYRILRGLIVIDEHHLITLKFTVSQITSNLKSLLNFNKDTNLEKTGLGKVMIIALLSLLTLQILASLFMTKVAVYSGLFGYSNISDAINFKELHEFIANLLLVLAIFHISANLWYFFYKKTNLIRGMFVDGLRETTKEKIIQISNKYKHTNALAIISNHYSIKIALLVLTIELVYILFSDSLLFLN